MPNLCKLGDVYFTIVKEEKYKNSSSATDRPVEDGSNIADNVKNNPVTLSISGILTSSEGYPWNAVEMLKSYQTNSILLTYVGVKTFGNCIIEEFDESYVKEIANGLSFSINLKEIRIASKVAINVDTSGLTIPDIEALKTQLSQAKSEAKSAARTKKKTSGGKKAKKESNSDKMLAEISSKYE